MAAVSSMLNQARKAKSPSRAHFKELKATGNEFFRLLKQNGALYEFGGRTKVLDARAYNRFYKRNVSPLQIRMEGKGVFFKFFFTMNFGIASDIFHQDAIRGCPALFCNNTEVFPLGRGGEYTLSRGCRGMHTLSSVTSYERISIFADHAASRLEENMLLGIPIPKTGISTIKEASDFLSASAYASAGSLEKDSLLNAIILEVLLHEAGHMLLGAKKGISGETSELFAYAFSLPNATKTRICLSKISEVYANGWCRPGKHFDGSNDFLGRLSSSLGLGWSSMQEQIISLIRYASVPEREIRAAGSRVLDGLCSTLGVGMDRVNEEITEPAKRVVFG